MNEKEKAMEFKELIPELSVFDIDETRDFYERLGFKVEYERPENKFVFMSFQGSQFMFEQIHEDGWNTGSLEYPLGRGVNFSIACDHVERLYEQVKRDELTIFRELTRASYEIQVEWKRSKLNFSYKILTAIS